MGHSVILSWMAKALMEPRGLQRGAVPAMSELRVEIMSIVTPKQFFMSQNEVFFSTSAVDFYWKILECNGGHRW